MGFFSSIGKLAKGAVRGVGKIAHGAVHNVSKAVHSVTAPAVKYAKKGLSIARSVPLVGGVIDKIGDAKVLGVSINDGLNVIDKANTVVGGIADLTDKNKSLGERFGAGRDIYRQFK